MTSIDLTPVPGLSPDFPPDTIVPPKDEDEAAGLGRLINERRAISENPELLRLARAL